MCVHKVEGNLENTPLPIYTAYTKSGYHIENGTSLYIMQI